MHTKGKKKNKKEKERKKERKRVLFKSTNGVTYMTAGERITVAQWRYNISNGSIACKREDQFVSTVQGSVFLPFSSRDAHKASNCLATAGVGNKNRCKIKKHKIGVKNMTF
jgi:hypothetical protein